MCKREPLDVSSCLIGLLQNEARAESIRNERFLCNRQQTCMIRQIPNTDVQIKVYASILYLVIMVVTEFEPLRVLFTILFEDGTTIFIIFNK